MASNVKSRQELTSDVALLQRDVRRLTKLASIHRQMIQVILVQLPALSSITIPSINSQRTLLAGGATSIWGSSSNIFAEVNLEEMMDNVPQTKKSP